MPSVPRASDRVRRSREGPQHSRDGTKRLTSVLAVFVLLSPFGAHAEVRAQTVLDPGQTAERFFRAIQLLNWEALAEMVHPTTLALFREQTSAMIDHDREGQVARRIFGEADAQTRSSWTHERLFAVVVEALYREVPALVQVMATNEYEIIGFVPDRDDRSQVVVRTTPYANGPVPTQLSVLTLAQDGAAWKVEDGAVIEALIVGLGAFGR
jgi:hypothetical protein